MSSLKIGLKRILHPLTRQIVYPVRFSGKTFRLQGGFGFLKKRQGAVEEEEFLCALDLTGKTVYDIGGYIGIFTLFFSKAVGERGHVVAFEPNPDSNLRIRRHLDINSATNVKLIDSGVGASEEICELVVRTTESGTGSLEPRIQQEIIEGGSYNRLKVNVASLDRLVEISRLPAPDLIKIDVEGMEWSVLKGMEDVVRRRAPALYIEMHGSTELDRKDNANRVVDWLEGHRYQIHHVESGATVTKASSERAEQGHLYCIPLKENYAR